MKKQVRLLIGLAVILLSGGMLFAQSAPIAAATTPTVGADSVISLYSDAYPPVPVDTWSASWDVADVTDTTVAADAVKLYTNLSYAGIEFTSSTIDASSMTRFHMDIWTPDAVDGGQVFKVKLVDFGADGAYGGSDDAEHELTFSSSTTPALATGSWVALDVALDDFAGLVTKGHLAQMIISGDPNTVWVDNIYLYNDGSAPVVDPVPSVAATTPTVNADSVISLYSDAYTDVTVDTWSASWDAAALTDTNVAGNATKLYQGLGFAGIEFTSSTIDVSSMTYFHMDIWTPDATDGAETFKVKLVDFGADGVWGSDDVEHQVILTNATTPAIASEQWVSLDIPMSDFTGLVTKEHLAQIVIEGDLPTVWVDNVYFYDDGSASVAEPTPMVAAPTPTVGADSVVSLYSDAYTDVSVSAWSTDWDNTDVADTNVAGNNTKLYSNLVFAGIEFTADASDMTHFHMDIWTPDATDGAEVFKIKLVDFGADGAYGGGDDVEHEVVLSNSSTPAIASEQWVGLDIPLSDFTGLTTTGHLAQMILSGDLGTVWIDNIYFYNGNVAGPTPDPIPMVAAPTPTVGADSVVSLYSDAYTDETVSTWSADWDMADVADTNVAGNATKLYTNMVYAGIEFATVDASSMKRFHMDIWTPDAVDAGQIFKVKLVDFGADGAYGGGDDVEHELTFSASSTPALASEAWVSLDVPLSDFSGLTTTGHLAQMIISGDLGTVWVDNIYFYDDGSGPVVVPTPMVAAPTPTAGADSVVSLFSDAYTDIPVSAWSTDWDQTNLADTNVAGNATKLYTGLVFAGIEFQADASLMTHFHMDIWTPDATDGAETFKIKLVDFGTDAAYGGGDDVEHEVVLTNATMPAIASEQWVGLDIPLSDFSGLVTRSAVSQIVLSGDLNTVWVDNVYFRADSAVGQATEPVVAAPVPDEDAANVISLFSDVYTDVPVDTWSASWDVANVADVEVAGDSMKLYTSMTFAGIEFANPTIDASQMEYFHMDVWTPDATETPAEFKIKLVDYGADGVWSGGGDDVEYELTFTDTTVPALRTANWVSFDIPMSDFTGLVTKGHLSQMILSGSLTTLYVDNVYFYKEPEIPTPLVSAPTPTVPESDVVSLFSNAYTDISVTTWSTDWDWASVEDYQIGSDDIKKYTSTGYSAAEFMADATTMTHFHVDLWTPDSVAGQEFKIKLVDFGNNGIYGGGDDVDHEITFTSASTPPLATAEWVSFDIPLEYFTGLTTRGHISQLIFSGGLGTYYVDNIYFYISEEEVPSPVAAAPTPVVAASNVISLFSDAYTDVAVDTWSASWDNASVVDTSVAGNATKLYTGLAFAGVEFTSSTIDATSMTHFHMDVWTPDSTSAPAVFKIKLVDFGANGTYDGGDDVDHEITLTSSTLPAMASEQWVSIDLPLSDFTGLTSRGHLAQLIISGDPNTVWIDNVYFYDDGTSSIDEMLIPTAYSLEQNYPNPFNPTTTIRFNLPEANHVTMTLYNILGQEIATLVNEYKEAGSFDYRLDASNLPTGTYFYSIVSGDFKEVKKMVLIK